MISWNIFPWVHNVACENKLHVCWFFCWKYSSFKSRIRMLMSKLLLVLSAQCVNCTYRCNWIQTWPYTMCFHPVCFSLFQCSLTSCDIFSLPLVRTLQRLMQWQNRWKGWKSSLNLKKERSAKWKMNWMPKTRRSTRAVRTVVYGRK